MHNHHQHANCCAHANLKYCSCCNTAYCVDCGYEWKNRAYATWYSPYVSYGSGNAFTMGNATSAGSFAGTAANSGSVDIPCSHTDANV